ncbi:MAG: hypothetical protein R3B13_22580 [Polyangiaceae bacterium]
MLLRLSALTVAFFLPALAHAQPFAEPTEGSATLATDGYQGPYDAPYAHEDHDDPPLSSSAVRVHTGPTLRISEADPAGGLFVALDVGEKAAGVRASGSWVRVGSDNGLSQYAGELWIDFGYDRRIHPIIGAGAGVARLDARDPQSGDLSSETVGIGLLRGAVEYVLPVRGTDARAGLEVLGAVPAIGSESAGNPKPWMLVTATVGIGF